jgi:hypothetical protein
MKSRRGVALFTVMLFTFAVAALAFSAVMLASGSNLRVRYYDRERGLRYVAQAALAQGQATVNADTALTLPNSSYLRLDTAAKLTDASGNVVTGAQYNLYVGYSGDSTGEYGQYVSLVADAYDSTGSHFIRRLELMNQNFARYSYFVDTWNQDGCFGGASYLKGVGHSNQNWISCNNPVYYDTISAVTTVTGGTPTYDHGYKTGVAVIPMPTVAKLAVLHDYAVDADYDIDATAGTSLSNLTTRIEFVPVDLDNDGNVTGANEGFMRVFQATNYANAGGSAYTRVGSDRIRVSSYLTTGLGTTQDGLYGTPPDDMCGDWHWDHTGQAHFFPLSVHGESWFTSGNENTIGPSTSTTYTAPTGTYKPDDPAPSTTTWYNPQALTGAAWLAVKETIMGHANYRCYAAGDPHLVAIERRAVLDPTGTTTSNDAKWQKGGDDTTFTATSPYGSWLPWSGTSVTSAFGNIASTSHYVGYTLNNMPSYLWPLSRTLNPNSRGVIHVHGPVAISGVLNGWITVYVQTYGSSIGKVLFIDDITYAEDPTANLCANILGLIAQDSMVIAQNAINAPTISGTTTTLSQLVWHGGDADVGDSYLANGIQTSTSFTLHAVILSMSGSLVADSVTNWANNGIAPTYGAGQLATCIGANNIQTTASDGCFHQLGGQIMEASGGIGVPDGSYQTSLLPSGSSGYNLAYVSLRDLDPCLKTHSPPYFPMTGAYTTNRYYEVDPSNFSIASFYTAIQSGAQ